MADALLTELATLCRQRSSTYGLLARIYRVEVDQEFLDTLHGMRFPAAAGNELAERGYRMVATYLSNIDERTVTELAVDYTRTFIGYGVDSYAAAFPYESVYTSEKRLKMQEARDEVLAIYHASALDKDPSWIENEDHVAVELEFMQVLCARAAKAAAGGDEDRTAALLQTQQNFLADHLAAWAPMMTADVHRLAKTAFYQGVAYLTDGFLAEETAFLADVLGTEE
jgi:TorA maturation chaperone TorD